MSCGKPHETPCSEVLERVYSYLDGELGDSGKAQIRQPAERFGELTLVSQLSRKCKRLLHMLLRRGPAP